MALEFVHVIAPSQNTPDLRRREVFRDAREISGIADVAGLTEVREREDHRDMRRGFGDKYVVRPDHPVSCPLALRRRKWVVLEVEVLVLHNGDKDIPTPARYAVRVLVRRRYRPLSRRVAFWNFHLINGAFNDRHPATKAQRRALWYRSMNTLTPEVLRDIASGYHVVLTGDPNSRDMPTFAKRQKVIFDGAVTYMAVIPAVGFKVVVKNRWNRDQKGDHRAFYARLRIVRA